jgi:hypothetical protein
MWRLIAAAAAVVVILSRTADLHLVWVEEAYGMAAAAELLRGKDLYSQIWFDKPPLYAWFYVLSGAALGWPLRIAGIAFVLAAAASIFLVARELWGEREGIIAGVLTCVSLTFWIPSAVMAIAPDLLMIVPHALAMLFAIRKRPLAAGVCAGMALLCNSKGVFVLGAVVLWCWPRVWPVLGGFAGVQAFSLLLLPVPDYWREVWAWGFRYSADTFLVSPLREAVVRTSGWMWFHATLCVGAVVWWRREGTGRLAGWILVSLLSVFAGMRFFPRYYFALLPVMAVVAARGLLLLAPRWRAVSLALLLIPMGRFGPRYVELMRNGTAGWSDTALMEDSRRAAQILRSSSESGDTLLVWGYRPDVFVFSGLPAGTRFLDSQPLTGVLADRHLAENRPTLADVAAGNRRELVKTSPVYIVDGLGPLNPALAIEGFGDLSHWLSRYKLIGRTDTTMIYRLTGGSE